MTSPRAGWGGCAGGAGRSGVAGDPERCERLKSPGGVGEGTSHGPRLALRAPASAAAYNSRSWVSSVLLRQHVYGHQEQKAPKAQTYVRHSPPNFPLRTTKTSNARINAPPHATNMGGRLQGVRVERVVRPPLGDDVQPTRPQGPRPRLDYTPAPATTNRKKREGGAPLPGSLLGVNAGFL